MPGIIWTEETVATLRTSLSKGLSASETARALGEGFTRNMVIGKARRLGASFERGLSFANTHRVQPDAERQRNREFKRRRAEEARKAQTARDQERRAGETDNFLRLQVEAEERACRAVELTPPLRIGLNELRHDSCRWPLGDPLADDFAFCGLHATRRAYCKAHAGIAYLPRVLRKKSAPQNAPA